VPVIVKIANDRNFATRSQQPPLNFRNRSRRSGTFTVTRNQFPIRLRKFQTLLRSPRRIRRVSTLRATVSAAPTAGGSRSSDHRIHRRVGHGGYGLNWDETVPAQVEALLGTQCANLA